MCTTCGCNPGEPAKMLIDINTGSLLMKKPSGKLYQLERNILHRNNQDAAHNRIHFRQEKLLAINMVSSPGSGKTSLLERTIRDLKQHVPFFVIEGDQQTMHDAQRIKAAGAPAIQINTGKACHLDASTIHQALHRTTVAANSILVIENVGNLVCPAMFDLGEKYRVVIMSVTEGEDKPLKYPYMFESADICIISKTDLLPYTEYDVEMAKEYAIRVNHRLKFFELSATKGQGLEGWYQWLLQEHRSLSL